MNKLTLEKPTSPSERARSNRYKQDERREKKAKKVTVYRAKTLGRTSPMKAENFEIIDLIHQFFNKHGLRPKHLHVIGSGAPRTWAMTVEGIGFVSLKIIYSTFAQEPFVS